MARSQDRQKFTAENRFVPDASAGVAAASLRANGTCAWRWYTAKFMRLTTSICTMFATAIYANAGHAQSAPPGAPRGALDDYHIASDVAWLTIANLDGTSDHPGVVANSVAALYETQRRTMVNDSGIFNSQTQLIVPCDHETVYVDPKFVKNIKQENRRTCAYEANLPEIVNQRMNFLTEPDPDGKTPTPTLLIVNIISYGIVLSPPAKPSNTIIAWGNREMPIEDILRAIVKISKLKNLNVVVLIDSCMSNNNVSPSDAQNIKAFAGGKVQLITTEGAHYVKGVMPVEVQDRLYKEQNVSPSEGADPLYGLVSILSGSGLSDAEISPFQLSFIAALTKLAVGSPNSVALDRPSELHFLPIYLEMTKLFPQVLPSSGATLALPDNNGLNSSPFNGPPFLTRVPIRVRLVNNSKGPIPDVLRKALERLAGDNGGSKQIVFSGALDEADLSIEVMPTTKPHLRMQIGAAYIESFEVPTSQIEMDSILNEILNDEFAYNAAVARDRLNVIVDVSNSMFRGDPEWVIRDAMVNLAAVDRIFIPKPGDATSFSLFHLGSETRELGTQGHLPCTAPKLADQTQAPATFEVSWNSYIQCVTQINLNLQVNTNFTRLREGLEETLQSESFSRGNALTHYTWLITDEVDALPWREERRCASERAEILDTHEFYEVPPEPISCERELDEAFDSEWPQIVQTTLDIRLPYFWLTWPNSPQWTERPYFWHSDASDRADYRRAKAGVRTLRGGHAPATRLGRIVDLADEVDELGKQQVQSEQDLESLRKEMQSVRQRLTDANLLNESVRWVDGPASGSQYIRNLHEPDRTLALEQRRRELEQTLRRLERAARHLDRQWRRAHRRHDTMERRLSHHGRQWSNAVGRLRQVESKLDQWASHSSGNVYPVARVSELVAVFPELVAQLPDYLPASATDAIASRGAIASISRLDTHYRYLRPGWGFDLGAFNLGLEWHSDSLQFDLQLPLAPWARRAIRRAYRDHKISAKSYWAYRTAREELAGMRQARPSDLRTELGINACDDKGRQAVYEAARKRYASGQQARQDLADAAFEECRTSYFDDVRALASANSDFTEVLLLDPAADSGTQTSLGTSNRVGLVAGGQGETISIMIEGGKNRLTAEANNLRKLELLSRKNVVIDTVELPSIDASDCGNGQTCYTLKQAYRKRTGSPYSDILILFFPSGKMGDATLYPLPPAGSDLSNPTGPITWYPLGARAIVISVGGEGHVEHNLLIQWETTTNPSGGGP